MVTLLHPGTQHSLSAWLKTHVWRNTELPSGTDLLHGLNFFDDVLRNGPLPVCDSHVSTDITIVVPSSVANSSRCAFLTSIEIEMLRINFFLALVLDSSAV